ncbi:YegP family protein [Streptomyces sp. NPDC059680]|uniref:YegP family protein n=1 Tax=Streptomyces sp. NPDC059680 TaxID=3346904 RepID=UPI0036C940BE
MSGKFEIFKDKSGKFRFRLKAANGEVIAASEGYESKASCQNGIASVMKNAQDASVVDLDQTAS